MQFREPVDPQGVATSFAGSNVDLPQFHTLGDMLLELVQRNEENSRKLQDVSLQLAEAERKFALIRAATIANSKEKAAARRDQEAEAVDPQLFADIKYLKRMVKVWETVMRHCQSSIGALQTMSSNLRTQHRTDVQLPSFRGSR